MRIVTSHPDASVGTGKSPRRFGRDRQVTIKGSGFFSCSGWLVLKNIFFLFSVLCFLFSAIGCQTLVRKFTRKPKGEPKKEVPLFQPQEYPDIGQTADQLYKDYFLFWENWADELIAHLSERANSKKQKECAREALDNLIKMQSLLNEEKSNVLTPLVNEFISIKDAVFAGNLDGATLYSLRRKAERIKSRVHRDFVYKKIQNDIKRTDSIK
jgi:hypothetical protein